MEQLTPTANPYVGPRTFTQAEAHLFFGRESEAGALLSLVISERLTLFYAQSGAGKSSLLHTRLIPQLRQAGFITLPVGRVSGERPPGLTGVPNIFVFNLMVSLEEGRGLPARLANLSLSHFLAHLISDDGQHYVYDAQAVAELPIPEEATYHVLIIDQFEEIITGHPDRWPERADFFAQLEQAMADDPYLWVVLTLREDFVAALDPYAARLEGKLRARYFMQRMSYEAALEAVTQPTALYRRPFAPGVAENLVDNLRQIRVQSEPVAPSASPKISSGDMPAVGLILKPGQFVEPVQLQVVCYRLWENLKTRPAAEITAQDLQESGNVDTALAEFYEQALTRVVAETGVSELDLRDWFERNLITEAGTRGGVYRGRTRSGGLLTRAADMLANQFILRTESRAGGTWFELVHDRFVDPIRQSNLRWRECQPLLQVARAWLSADRTDKLLLEGQPLKEALATPWQGLGPLVEEFLKASQLAQRAREDALEAEREAARQRELEATRQLAAETEARRQVEEQLRQAAESREREQAAQNRQLKRLVIATSALAVAAVVFALIAGGAIRVAFSQFDYAIAAEATATVVQATATVAQATADYEATQAAQNEATAAAMAAMAVAAAAEINATAAAATATAETEATTTVEARSTEIAALKTQLATPTPTETATPTPTPGSAPTTADIPTDTPTPDLEATTAAQVALTVTAQAIEAIETQLAQIVATQTESAKPTPTATPTLTPIPVTFPPPGRIVFVSNRPGNKGSLMIMSADGSNVTQLTPVNTEAFHPSYSPPKNLVVYSTNQPPNKPAYLYTITLDGQVEANPGGQSFNDWWQPAFSPDGQRIAFVSARNGNMDIYSMNSDGSDLKQLTDDPARDLSPAWSPDNMRLAFVSERRGGADIFLMNADGSSPVRLTTNGHNPAWSPDGQQIAFVSTRDGNAEIYLADLRQGGQESRFTNTPQDENFPAFSLDGNWLAFTRYVDNLNHTEILVVTTTGREEHNLTNHPADDWQPIWVKGE